MCYNVHMMTIDDIIFKIEKYGVFNLGPCIPKKDQNILSNMAKLLKSSNYITVNQGSLIIKILKENLEHLNFVGTELITALKAPSWSRSFKNPEKIRKIYLNNTNTNNPTIVVKATYSKDLKKTIVELQKNSEGSFQEVLGSEYHISLTEKNLIKTLSTLKKYNFEKSAEILDLYQKIKSLNLNEIERQFDIELLNEENLKKLLIDDIGVVNSRDPLFLNDRRIKFQYTYNKKIQGVDENSLLYKISTRKNNQIFLNSEKFTTVELASVLRRLHRLPVLIILDEYDAKTSLENLKIIKKTMDSLDFQGNTGVYFRFDNEGNGAEFNKLVAEYKYNKKLDNDNKLTILSNGKIPKFLLKNNWYPKSVISFTNNLRNNKTSVYCNECDLIVYYTSNQPVFGNVDVIL